MKIYGREKELQQLKKLYNSSHFEFVVIKGRRRVGKTFLVDTFFNYKYAFFHAGVSPEELSKNEESALSQQLGFFLQSLRKYGESRTKRITSWSDAFACLELLLEKKKDEKRVVVFIDEMPWLATPKSQFVAAFSYFLNNFASKMENLLLVVSGSSNSWLDDQFSKTYGGFYHRKTKTIKLSPLSIGVCKQMITDSGMPISDYEMAKLYMIFGGIPYYLRLLDADLTVGENIDELFFSNEGELKNEFNNLFNSIFRKADKAKLVVRLLSNKRIGYTQESIAEKTGISDGGGLSDILEALESSDIIAKYSPLNENKNVRYYKLVDPFCLFYLKAIEGNPTLDPVFFQENQFSKKFEIFMGFAFENLVFYNIDKIKRALGIIGVTSDVAGLKIEDMETEEQGQIDLLILRKDNVVNCCEIKFSGEEYVLSKEYWEKLRAREGMLATKLKKRQAIDHVLIAPFGLKKNKYSSFFRKVITLKDLL